MFNFIKIKYRNKFTQSSVKINAVGIKDIVFLFVTFSFILYMLFPKETLKEKVLKETKSNDLALVYIENMINFDYKNYELLLHFANINFQEDNFPAVRGIIGTLLHSDNQEIQNSALLLGEKLFKREYFMIEDKNITKEEEEKEKDALLSEYQNIIQRMVLVSKDEKFQNDILTYFKGEKNRDKYITLLTKLATVDKKWEITLAEYYVANNKLSQALILYQRSLSNSSSYKDKKRFFKKTLQILMYGSFFEEGTKIMQKYENFFIKDEEMFEKIIRFYLAAGKQKKARKYILKRDKY